MMLELAEDLNNLGWEVTVITGFPNHPRGLVYPGFDKRWFHEEQRGHIRIWRVWLATLGRSSIFRRMLTFATFSLVASWTFLRRARCDVVFAVMQPLPIAAMLPILARLKKARLVFNVQDLHPETQIRLGIIKNRIAVSVLRAIERYGYRRCDKLTVICDEFRDHALRNDALANSISVIENWIDTDAVKPDSRVNEIRDQLGLTDKHQVALWAGTLGLVSGAGILLDAAAHLTAMPDAVIVICGEGPIREQLMTEAEARQLCNVRFLPFQPNERVNDLQSIADVSLVTLSKEFSESSVPSKVLAYMAAARPLVAAVPRESPTARLIQEANCGRIVDSGDSVALAQNILNLFNNKPLSDTLANNGRSFVVSERSRAAAARKYNDLLISAIEGAS